MYRSQRGTGHLKYAFGCTSFGHHSSLCQCNGNFSLTTRQFIPSFSLSVLNLTTTATDVLPSCRFFGCYCVTLVTPFISRRKAKNRLNRWLHTKKQRDTSKVSLLYLSHRKKGKTDILRSQTSVFYSWTYPQRPPWGQNKEAFVETLKQEWMYGLSAKKVAAVERLKQESMYGLSAKKVTVVERLKQESMYGLSAKKVTVVERLKQEWMYGLSAKKVAAVERWPLVEVWPQRWTVACNATPTLLWASKFTFHTRNLRLGGLWCERFRGRFPRVTSNLRFDFFPFRVAWSSLSTCKIEPWWREGIK